MKFSLSESENQTFINWLGTHNRTCKFANGAPQGAAGGTLTYQFTPNSLGIVAKVICACGEEKDLTDYNEW